MSSDDFFNSQLTSPPKQAASLNAASSTNNATGSASASTRQRRAPPPPPPPPRPKPTANTSATTTSKASNTPVGQTATRTRPAPSRPAASTSSSTRTRTSNVSRTAAPAPELAPPRPATTSTSSRNTTAPNPRPVPSRTSRTTTAPKVSRPVGSYYNAAAAAVPTTTTATSTTSSGYYGSTPPAATSIATPSTNPNTAAWDDWGTAAPSPAATSSQNASTPYSTWAPPPAAAATTDQNNDNEHDSDWFTDTTDNEASTAAAYQTPHYSSTGFYGGANNKNFVTTTGPTQTTTMDLSGTMDESSFAMPPTASSAPTIFQPQTFVPSASSAASMGDYSNNMIQDDEAPLLEELGVNLQHIGMKTKAVILPLARFHKEDAHGMQPADIVKDADLAGPIAFCLILGAEMVLTGKLQFGYIYGFGVFGCISMTLIVNLMSPLSEGISIWTVSSVLGYALIPVNLLAAVKLIVMNLVKMQTLGRILGLLTVAWSTTASTRLLELGCGLREQRYLIAYPIALLYSAFVMITIF